MQPMPAAVTAWRKISSLTSPAANTPGMDVAVESGAVMQIARRLHLELALEQLGCRRVTDGDENAIGGSSVACRS